MKRNVTHVRHDMWRIAYLKVDGHEMQREDCIKEIDSGIEYWTTPPHGEGVLIEVQQHNLTRILHTYPDGTEENNLGGLPEF